MRALITADIFSFSRVIKASGIREDLVSYLKTVNTDSDKEQVGMTTILMIIEALSDKKAEVAVYEALAPVFEMTTDEVRQLPPSDLFAKLKQMAEENDLGNFFNSVFGTLGKN